MTANFTCRTVTGNPRTESSTDFLDRIAPLYGHRTRAEIARDEARQAEMRKADADGDNRKCADLILACIAEKVGMPFDELKKRTKSQWL